MDSHNHAAPAVVAQPGQIGGVELLTVDARELHQALESRQDFSNWIKARIRRYGFAEGMDYEVFDKPIENPKGGRPVQEYRLSLDAAKELAMVEGTERGRQVRRYFIDCERRLHEQRPQAVSLPGTASGVLVFRLQVELLAANRLYQNIVRYQRLGLNPLEIAVLVNQTARRTAQALADLAACELVPAAFAALAAQLAEPKIAGPYKQQRKAEPIRPKPVEQLTLLPDPAPAEPLAPLPTKCGKPIGRGRRAAS
ncbi:MAG: antA/AntB antirepressor family protein [Gammaproteobacteria bacterium]|nr:antA/AntB antirepressor family protein [Gammaproteobacteria bacterium]